MTVARDQFCSAIVDYGECSKAVPFDFKDEVGIIERHTPLKERHWLELEGHLRVFRISGRGEFQAEAKLVITLPPRRHARNSISNDSA